MVKIRGLFPFSPSYVIAHVLEVTRIRRQNERRLNGHLAVIAKNG